MLGRRKASLVVKKVERRPARQAERGGGDIDARLALGAPFHRWAVVRQPLANGAPSGCFLQPAVEDFDLAAEGNRAATGAARELHN